MKTIKTEFDATLHHGLDEVTGLEGLIIESRGGTKKSNNYRNPEHSLLLAYVLKRLQNANTSDLEIYVASNSSSYKNISDRKISYDGNFEIDLTTVTDFETFLKLIKKSIKNSGQNEGSSGGNSTKRLLLFSRKFSLQILLESSVTSPIENLNEDEVEYAYRKLKKRLRQTKFRNELLQAYNYTCSITGSKVKYLLEAAHIQPYSGKHSSYVNNGILLRSDIHDLFDLYEDGKRLLNITKTYKVEVHDSLKESEYWQYNGQETALPKDESDYPRF